MLLRASGRRGAQQEIVGRRISSCVSQDMQPSRRHLYATKSNGAIMYTSRSFYSKMPAFKNFLSQKFFSVVGGARDEGKGGEKAVNEARRDDRMAEQKEKLDAKEVLDKDKEAVLRASEKEGVGPVKSVEDCESRIIDGSQVKASIEEGVENVTVEKNNPGIGEDKGDDMLSNELDLQKLEKQLQEENFGLPKGDAIYGGGRKRKRGAGARLSLARDRAVKALTKLMEGDKIETLDTSEVENGRNFIDNQKMSLAEIDPRLNQLQSFSFDDPEKNVQAAGVGSEDKGGEESDGDFLGSDSGGEKDGLGDLGSGGGSGSGSRSSLPVRKSLDSYPTPPLVCGLPVFKRPLFPGQFAAVKVRHPGVIMRLQMLKKSNMPYVVAFQRRDVNFEKSLKEKEKATDGEVEAAREGLSGADQSSLDSLYPQDYVHDAWDELYDVGTFAVIHQIFKDEGSSHVHVFLSGIRRVQMLKVENEGPPLELRVDHWVDPVKPQKRLRGSEEAGVSTLHVDQGVEEHVKGPKGMLAQAFNSLLSDLYPSPAEEAVLKALAQEAISLVRQIAQLNPLFKEQVEYIQTQIEKVDMSKPGLIADFVTAMTTASPHELQEVLKERGIRRRLEKSLDLLKHELEVSELQSKIRADVEKKMSKEQREFFLREQLKVIKKELGVEKDDKDALIEKIQLKLEGKKVPADVQSVIDEELQKLQVLHKSSSDFNISHSYLDWLGSLPWGVYTKENYDIQKAKKILDTDHYGLKDVKERILEFIAVGKLRGTLEGKIICLIGPPGVGKTSVGQSIAHSLSREFYRFSVGGLSDVAEIKGHRKTYVGAMPGKIVQCLKKTAVQNPMILIDEIDKLGSAGHRGDPASALLEVLDPSQNSSFVDHYLDVPLDLSKVLFVCTANEEGAIPGPLHDRMEIIRLSGYDMKEKLSIAKQYLIPKAVKASGLEKSEKIHFSDCAIKEMIKSYCREAGVRSLEKTIEKICRKLAFQVAEKREKAEQELIAMLSEEERKTAEQKGACDQIKDKVPSGVSCEVQEQSLEQFIGKKVFLSDRLYECSSPPGVVMGLAWTSMGGCALYVEAVTYSPQEEGKGGAVEITGQLGKVMTESTKIAMTVVKRVLERQIQKREELTLKEKTQDTADVGLCESSGQKVNSEPLGKLRTSSESFGDFLPLSSLPTPLDVQKKFFYSNNFHLHFPEGATPKDGPSAGVTIATSLLSLALGRGVKEGVAMTGEISLNGLVLPVGGIKEKIIAGKRAGASVILLPHENRRDVSELPPYIVDNLKIYFCKNFDHVAFFSLGVGEMETAVIEQLQYFPEKKDEK